MSTLMTKLFRKNRIITICPLVSDCTIGRNFCFPYTIWLKSRRKMQPLPVYVSAKFHIDIFHCKQDIVLGIFHIRSNNCLANERFFDYHFASLAPPHSKTRQYYDIGCRRYGICEHGSMSTLITKLFRKKRIILPSVHLSQIVLSAVTSVFLIQYNTIQYNTIQYNTIQYNIVYFQHRTQLHHNSNFYPILGWLERGWTEE